jgi:ABC-2 type transport system permease protein
MALALIQTTIFVTIAVIFGARVEGGVAGVLLLLLLAAILAAGISGLGVFLALRSGSAEAVQGTFPLFFILLFFSSAFFPRETMDGWFKAVADVNPISHLVESMRDLVITGVDLRSTLTGLGVALGIAVVTVSASALAFRRRLKGMS